MGAIAYNPISRSTITVYLFMPLKLQIIYTTNTLAIKSGFSEHENTVFFYEIE